MINKICLGCPDLNRACDGSEAGCKSQNPEARKRYVKQLAAAGVNSMCFDCQHLNRACDGTTNPVYGGCILKDQPPEVAKAYIDRMTELIQEAAK